MERRRPDHEFISSSQLHGRHSSHPAGRGRLRCGHGSQSRQRDLRRRNFYHHGRPPPNMLCSPLLLPRQTGIAFSSTCTASGGAPPYNWSIITGTLPARTFAKRNDGSEHHHQRRPTAAGPYNFIVQVADSTSAHWLRTFAILSGNHPRATGLDVPQCERNGAARRAVPIHLHGFRRNAALLLELRAAAISSRRPPSPEQHHVYRHPYGLHSIHQIQCLPDRQRQPRESRPGNELRDPAGYELHAVNRSRAGEAPLYSSTAP